MYRMLKQLASCWSHRRKRANKAVDGSGFGPNSSSTTMAANVSEKFSLEVQEEILQGRDQWQNGQGSVSPRAVSNVAEWELEILAVLNSSWQP
mmetsp:Transcript_61308/g.121357  ORF Transcript_61308/g.121357 Transcript_61308/m.121357 type:complete len:93 (-) Transcript_61308:19-297(-)